MFTMNGLREATVIDVYKEDKLIGTFINMNTINSKLPKGQLYTYKFHKISEQDSRFNILLAKGFCKSR